MQTETCRAACREFHVVGDHKHRGSASGFFCKNICHDPPQCIIECTRGFIHNEDRTPQLKCSDECKALLLATAEVSCAFVEVEVEAILPQTLLHLKSSEQRLDHGRIHLNPRHPQGEVFGHCSSKKKRMLTHIGAGA